MGRSPILEPQDDLLNEMFPLDGSWEGNSPEEISEYEAVHEEANLNHEIMKENEAQLKAQRQQQLQDDADGQ